MHPALQLSNFNHLPPTLRRVALTACSENRSAHDLARLRTYLRTSTNEQERWMIPAFYFNLDTNDIPDASGFDPETMSPTTESAIDRAWSSLQSLYIIDFPLCIGTDVWPRALQWDQASYALIKSTPAFWFMLGDAWLHLIQSADYSRRGELDLLLFINAPEVAEPANLAELVEGVGGAMEELARVVTRYLPLVLPRSPDVVDVLAVHFLGYVVQFCQAIDPSQALVRPPRGVYSITLLSENIIPMLTDGLCAGIRVLAQGGDPGEMHVIAGIVEQTYNIRKNSPQRI
ncbi:hypothetical protein B0H16DRAFT_1738736 [Mycena metata]|uniref:Uncharacterized protein n=1 Tax=Mycena metata TaxID=1033252 RepID=A0AAD7HH30_9AGAR|nr:hypothetical protein B0H16DRAFT_1738736 [Mycena metata]